FTITASNGVDPDATQIFTLTVNEAPTITSVDATTFTVGAFDAFTIATSHSFPTPTVLRIPAGSLPGGVSFTNNGDGTATISGTPDAGTGAMYSLTTTASNALA